MCLSTFTGPMYRSAIMSRANEKCPYCIELAPTYDRLGAFYENATDKITIAKCDVSVLPIPDISYFPTIKMFAAEDKDFPVEYISEDPDDIQGYLNFIKEEGSHHAEAKE